MQKVEVKIVHFFFKLKITMPGQINRESVEQVKIKRSKIIKGGGSPNTRGQ